MPDLVWNQELPGIATRQDLARAGREMAQVLARELGRRRTVYRELYLAAAAADGVTQTSRIFPGPQGPEKLPWHIGGLLARLAVPGPLTGLTVRLAGCSPADPEQLAFSGWRENRLRRLLAEAGCRLVHPAPDRREKMLSFYDPFRRG